MNNNNNIKNQLQEAQREVARLQQLYDSNQVNYYDDLRSRSHRLAVQLTGHPASESRKINGHDTVVVTSVNGVDVIKAAAYGHNDFEYTFEILDPTEEECLGNEAYYEEAEAQIDDIHKWLRAFKLDNDLRSVAQQLADDYRSALGLPADADLDAVDLHHFIGKRLLSELTLR